MELFQNCSNENFTDFVIHLKVSKKDISLQRKQWCLFYLHISFLHHFSSNLDLRLSHHKSKVKCYLV